MSTLFLGLLLKQKKNSVSMDLRKVLTWSLIYSQHWLELSNKIQSIAVQRESQGYQLHGYWAVRQTCTSHSLK